MYSSLRIAFRKDGSLYWGCTRHRAAATIEAVRGPVTLVAVRNSAMFGVNLNGTGLLASNSPVQNINDLVIIVLEVHAFIKFIHYNKSLKPNMAIPF